MLLPQAPQAPNQSYVQPDGSRVLAVGHDLSFEGTRKLVLDTNAPSNSFVRIDLVNEVVTIVQPPDNQSMLEYLGLLNTQPSIPEGRDD
jgi:hypothetical protein